MPNLTALIPLDTTEFSESSFRLVPLLKTLGFSNVRLITVLNDKSRKAGYDRAKLEAYLEEKAALVSGMGMVAETRLAEGDAADACIAAAGEADVDLVLVATHGRTGIARLRLGSVGEKLIKDAPCPRIVIGPNIEIDLESYALKRILVPLDGSEASELSLPIARYIAGLANAEVDLLRSVSLTSVPADAMMAGVDTFTPMMDEARSYLDGVSGTFPGRTVHSTVVTGSAAESILEHLKANPVDLVIMVSRGLTGLGRMAMGSVTERVLQGPDPVLVFEPNEDRSRLFEAARAAV